MWDLSSPTGIEPMPTALGVQSLNHHVVPVCLLSHFSHVRLCIPMDCSPPGSSVHGTLQARTLEWVIMPFSRESSWPRNRTHVSYISCIGRWVLYLWHHLETPDYQGSAPQIHSLHSLWSLGTRPVFYLSSYLLTLFHKTCSNCLLPIPPPIHKYPMKVDIADKNWLKAQTNPFYLIMTGKFLFKPPLQLSGNM